MLSDTRKEELWAEHCYTVGRAMHEGWKRQKIANGFAVHPSYSNNASRGDALCDYSLGSVDSKIVRCCLPRDKHHDDMTDWDLLPLHQQAINYEEGKAGFLLGLDQGYQEFMRELRAYAMQFKDQPAVIEVHVGDGPLGSEWKEKNS